MTTFVSVTDVGTHLDEMIVIHDKTKNLDKYQLYEYLCSLENDYIKYLKQNSFNQQFNNFCYTVHKLHPKIFREDAAHINQYRQLLMSISECNKCWNCEKQLSTADMYSLHMDPIMKNRTILCQCGENITLESLVVTAAISKYNTNSHLMLGHILSYSFPKNVTEKCPTWKKFGLAIKKEIEKTCRYTVDTKYVLVDMIKKFSTLSSFKMDLVKGMYRQMDFVNKVCCNINYWKNEANIKRSISRYKKFLTLIKSKNKILVPTVDIDLAWHTHQCNHSNYYNYCMRQIGRLVNHDDTIGPCDLQRAYAKTFIYWSEKYNNPYSFHPPSLEHWYEGHECFSSLIPFYANLRIYRWIRHSRVINLSEDEFKELYSGAIIGTPVMNAKVDTKDTTFDDSLYVTLGHINQSAENTSTYSYDNRNTGCGGGCAVYVGGCGGHGHGCGGGGHGGCGGGHGGCGGCSGGGGCGGCGGCGG